MSASMLLWCWSCIQLEVYIFDVNVPNALFSGDIFVIRLPNVEYYLPFFVLLFSVCGIPSDLNLDFGTELWIAFDGIHCTRSFECDKEAGAASWSRVAGVLIGFFFWGFSRGVSSDREAAADGNGSVGEQTEGPNNSFACRGTFRRTTRIELSKSKTTLLSGLIIWGHCLA